MEKLTKRELDVLRLMAYPWSEIQEKLNIKTPTLRTHVAHIHQKLCSENRAETLIKALKKGLIKLDEIEVKND